MNDEFESERAFVASVILAAILANRNYDPPRRNKMKGMCDEAVMFADCLIDKLKETEDL